MQLVANNNSQLAPDLAARLQDEMPDVEVIWVDKEGQPTAPISNAEVLFRFDMNTSVLIKTLQTMPKLQWIHTGSAGIENILPHFISYAPSEAILTNGAGQASIPIAQFVLTQILSTSRQLPEYVVAQQQRIWLRPSLRNNPPDVIEVADMRVLVLGTGSIGSEVAKICSAVGMHVWGVRRQAATIQPPFQQVMSFDDDWRALLPAMDYMVLCLPLTDESFELIGPRELAAMKSTGWLINIARGAIIDESALISALHEKRIGGAALDVTVTEPLPTDSPLWNCPNVILTPHISWRSPQFDQRSIDLFIDNLHRYRSGQPLVNLIPREKGY